MFLVWPPLLYTVMLVAIAMLCKEIGVTVIGVCCVYEIKIRSRNTYVHTCMISKLWKGRW
jgi:hypothetical protein